MLVDIRPINRLHGAKPVDVAGTLDPIVSALSENPDDLARTRLVYDWVQYKNNFREIVDVRTIQGTRGAAGGPEQIELAVDLRRANAADIGDAARLALAQNRDSSTSGRIYLQDWSAGVDSIIWAFNGLYWKALSLWEEASGHAYEQALPGGQSDATNVDGVRELITQLFGVWDSLAERNALPDALYVVELGVGNGNQARTWLDVFTELDAEHGKDYYRRLHYLMADYSPHVLELARAAVAPHAEHVSAVVLDATKPQTALGFLRYKAFLVYISNVYDNLPTDEIASIGGRVYRVAVRAYLSGDAAAQIAAKISVTPEQLPDLVSRLLRLGPELLHEAAPATFADVAAAVDFWRECWDAVRLEERYEPLGGLDLYEIAPNVSGEALRPLLESGGDIRMQVSNGAVASFVDTLPLLHPYGQLLNHDIFVTDLRRYQQAFSGPGKYDGSVVNWVNGALLQHIGNRRGFELQIQAFAHRQGTNVTTLTARVRD